MIGERSSKMKKIGRVDGYLLLMFTAILGFIIVIVTLAMVEGQEIKAIQPPSKPRIIAVDDELVLPIIVKDQVFTTKEEWERYCRIKETTESTDEALKIYRNEIPHTPAE